MAGYNPYLTKGRSSLLNYASGKPVATKNDIEYYINNYLTDIRPRVRKSSFQHYQSKYRILYEYCILNKCLHLHQWTSIQADLFVQHLTGSEKSNATVNDYITLCRSFFEFCKKYNDLENPFNKMRKFKKINRPATRFDTVDMVRLFTHLEKHDTILLLFCRMVLYMFIRPHSELRYMQISWVDFDNENITIPATISKNNKEYTLPIPHNKLLEQLQTYRECSKELYLFTKSGIPGPHCCSKNYWAKRYNEIRDTLHLSPAYTLYSLKHTGAILLHNSGASTKEIQMQMRHHSLDETDKYLRQMMAVESDHIRYKGPNF